MLRRLITAVRFDVDVPHSQGTLDGFGVFYGRYANIVHPHQLVNLTLVIYLGIHLPKGCALIYLGQLVSDLAPSENIVLVMVNSVLPDFKPLKRPAQSAFFHYYSNAENTITFPASVNILL